MEIIKQIEETQEQIEEIKNIQKDIQKEIDKILNIKSNLDNIVEKIEEVFLMREKNRKIEIE